jgi:hypothetical protein
VGRAVHQGPDTDGTTTLTPGSAAGRGQLVPALVTATEGIDLIARPDGLPW